MHSRDGSLAGGETDEHLYKSSSAEVVPNVSFQDSYVSKYFLKKRFIFDVCYEYDSFIISM